MSPPTSFPWISRSSHSTWNSLRERGSSWPSAFLFLFRWPTCSTATRYASTSSCATQTDRLAHLAADPPGHRAHGRRRPHRVGTCSARAPRAKEHARSGALMARGERGSRVDRTSISSRCRRRPGRRARPTRALRGTRSPKPCLHIPTSTRSRRHSRVADERARARIRRLKWSRGFESLTLGTSTRAPRERRQDSLVRLSR